MLTKETRRTLQREQLQCLEVDNYKADQAAVLGYQTARKDAEIGNAVS